MVGADPLAERYRDTAGGVHSYLKAIAWDRRKSLSQGECNRNDVANDVCHLSKSNNGNIVSWVHPSAEMSQTR